MAALDSNEASVSGDYIAHTEGAKLSTSLFQDSHIKSLRLINTLSYAFTAITVLSTVPTYFANYEYNNGNYTEWMTDQTLLSVAPSTQFIWYLLFILQGLFIVAAFLPSLQFSELLGYTFLASNNHNSSKNDNSSNKSGRGGAVIELRRSTLRDYTNTSVVVQYPALCASTLLMMYSAKLKFMTLAFVGSFISTYLLVNITKFQAVATAAAAARSSEGDANSNSDTATFKSEIITYICLKLPFELYTGYALALTIMFFNIIIHKSFGSTVLSVILAIVSLVMMLIVGCYVTWNKGVFGLNYGFGVGLIWYMLGVYFQLIDSSTPIVMTYSSGMIDAVKYMAVTFANIILSSVALHVTKNYLNCVGLSDDSICEGEETGYTNTDEESLQDDDDGDENDDGDDDEQKGYVQV